MTSSDRFFGRLSFLFALSALAACSGKSERVPVDEAPLGCAEDLDKDGYGLGCPQGDDCNDQDASIHSGCAACATPEQGCACEPGSAPVECTDKSLLDEDTVLCKTGTRYCRDATWSACESVGQFEVAVDRESRVGGHTQKLVDQDASYGDAGMPSCSICDKQCYEIEDPLDPRQGGLPGNVVYADGGGITLPSELDGGGIVIAPTTDCLPGQDPDDADCDGIPDQYESVQNDDTKPFGLTTPTAIFMTLGPGESGTANIDLQFYLRTVDVYFLFDMTAATAIDDMGTPDTSDDHTVVDQLIASLNANPVNPGQSFFDGSVTCADSNRDGVPDDTRGQGIVGDLKCLVRDIGFGVGWTREVPFEGPVDNIFFGDDRIDPYTGDTNPTPAFSEFLFEQTSFITSDASVLSSGLSKLSLKENAGGPNGQIQGLWLTATGQELYVGHDRPALPDQTRCAVDAIGYPCFRSAAVPVVVLFTGEHMYNGPTTDHKSNAISFGTDGMGNNYPQSYPAALHTNKVNRGSYEGYIEVANTNYDFDSPTRTDFLTNPGTGALIGDIGDDLLTFTGDSTGMGADVDASLLSCGGETTAAGADVVYYFTLANNEPNFTVSAEGTRFDSVIGIIKSSNGTVPDTQNFDVTEYSTSGDTAGEAHDLQTLPSGINAIVRGELAATGNFPAEILECYSHASQGQCGQSNKASDYAPDVVFKFNLEQDMRLWFQSANDWDSSLALFDSMPAGVTDLNIIDTGTGEPYETYNLPGGAGSDPGPLNGKSYRLVGNTYSADGCNAFNINNLNEDYLNSAVLYTSAPDTDPNTSLGQSHCNANGFKDASSDMEVRFTITQDATNVVFETSGDNPKLDANENVLLALRKIDAPQPNAHTPTTNEDFPTAHDIPQADFTPVSGSTEFAQATGDMTGMWSDLYYGEMLTKTVSLTGAVGSCSLPSGGLANYQDAVFKFTTTSTRSLKISALGVTGVKHFLSVHRKSTFEYDPELNYPYYTTDTIDETGTVTSTDVSSPSSGYTANGGAFELSQAKAIINNTANAPSTTWDNAYMPNNKGGSASQVQYYTLYADQVEGPVTLTLNYPSTAWRSSLQVMRSDLTTSMGWASASDTNTRTVSFTPVAGQTYYIFVGGHDTADKGTYRLTATPTFSLHDTLATAHHMGTLTDSAISIKSSTAKAGVTANYDNSGGDKVFCNRANKLAKDQVYSFTSGVAAGSMIKVSLNPTTAWQSNVQIYTKVGSNLGVKVAAKNSAGATSTDGCEGGSNNNARSLTFTPTTNYQEYFVIVSGWDDTASSAGAYTLTVEDLQLGAVACTSTTAPERAIITLNNMPADTYYVVLKIDDAAGFYPGTYDVTIEDATVGPTTQVESTFVCELNNYQAYEDIYIGGSTPKRTKLEQTLDTGTYSLIMRTVGSSGGSTSLRLVMRDKAVQPDVVGCHNDGGGGGGGEVREYFDYSDSPLPACEDGYLPANDCQDGSGVSHYKDYYLVMRAFREGDVSDPDADPYTVYIRDLDAGEPLDFCENVGSGLNSFTGNLDAGNYFVVLKGIGADDEGWYQLTIGDTTTTLGDANFSDLKSYSGTGGVLESLNAKGIRVIGVQDGTDASVKQQLNRVAYDTNTKFLTPADEPLVIQLSDSATSDGKTIFELADVGKGVTRAIQELSKSLVMDVTLVLDTSDPDKLNPGFTFQAVATGSEPNCNGGISTDGTTWKSCATGAEPKFNVIFGNPAAPDSVPFNDEDKDGTPGGTAADPDDPGGYDMVLNLVGKVQVGTDAMNMPIYRSYIVERVPVRIIPDELGYHGAVRYYAAEGTYSQDFSATQCQLPQTPDWSRLSWSATIPDDSELEWLICSANSEAGAETCSGKFVARATSGNACTSDANCMDGFCDNGTCMYIEGPLCNTDAECGGRGADLGWCDGSGTCRWPKTLIDVAPAMQYGDNGKKFVRVDAVMRAASDFRSAPTVHSWKLEYDCVSGE